MNTNIMTADRAAAYLAVFDYTLYSIPTGFAVVDPDDKDPTGFYDEAPTPERAVVDFNHHLFGTRAVVNGYEEGDF